VRSSSWSVVVVVGRLLSEEMTTNDDVVIRRLVATSMTWHLFRGQEGDFGNVLWVLTWCWTRRCHRQTKRHVNGRATSSSSPLVDLACSRSLAGC
jgi:hypothetical protein